MKNRGLATIATHSYRPFDAVAEPLTPPLTLASVYTFTDLDTLLAASRGEGGQETFYRRYGHPNGRLLEEAVAALEGAEDAVACSAGMSAAAGILRTLAGRGDRILACDDLYGGTTAFLQQEMAKVGAVVTFAPLAVLEREIPGGTRLVLVETISNPLIRVADLRRIARNAKRAGALMAVDNTFATPFLRRPLEWGADLVWHSGTKFLNGHGDATSGLICGSKRLLAPIRKHQILAGGTIPPMDAWLTLRGLKTLGLRIERSTVNAKRLAAFLARHPKVARVHYSKPLPGPMLSFELRGGLRAAARFVRACKLIHLAPSLGDVTTTSSHPARSSHAYLSPAERARIGIGDGLLRISTGIEDVRDLIDDLKNALSKA